MTAGGGQAARDAAEDELRIRRQTSALSVEQAGVEHPAAPDIQPAFGNGGMAFGPNNVLELQSTLGNKAVQRLISRATLQRDDGDPAVQDPVAAPSDDPMAGMTWGDEAEGTYELSTPDPIPLPPDALGPQGPGDYPMPADPNVAMAMRLPLGATIQRDDPQPGLSGDATLGVQTPGHVPPGSAAPGAFQVTGTILIRDANIKAWGFKNPVFTGLDLGHELSWQWSFDSKGNLQQQLGITLVNTHWMPPWGKEIELGLSGFFQSTVFPNNSNPLAPGAQLQLEQHLIVPWFSVTLTASGVYDNASGQMATVGGINLLFHAPTLKPTPKSP